MNRFKRSLIKAIFILLVFLAFFGLFTKRFKQPTGEFPSSGSVKKNEVVVVVYDGDTVKVRFRDGSLRRVRLIGINAPETQDEREEVRFRALVSRRFTFYHLYKKEVSLAYDWQLEDKYGRLLAYIWIDEGLFNDFIIREGFAFVFLKFPFRKDYQEKFKESENFARINGRGFWKEGNLRQINFKEARKHLGELISVEYKCSSLKTKRQFLFLNSAKEEFAALIPLGNLSHFPDSNSYLNKNLLVTGFLEEFKGQPQIVVYLPFQVKIIKRD